MAGSYARDALSGSAPVLRGVARMLRIAGRIVQGLGLAGAAGTLLLTWALVASFGWGGLLGLLAAVLPWRALLVGHHAVAGSALLADPRRLQETVRTMAGTGRQWLDQVAQLRDGEGRRSGRAARVVLGTGRSLWTALSPSVEGAASLRELAIWPKTLSGLGAAALCPVLLLLGLGAGLVVALT